MGLAQLYKDVKSVKTPFSLAVLSQELHSNHLPSRSCLEPSIFCGEAELHLKIDILPLMSHFSKRKICSWSMAKLNFPNLIYSRYFLIFLQCFGAELKLGLGWVMFESHQGLWRCGSVISPGRESGGFQQGVLVWEHPLGEPLNPWLGRWERKFSSDALESDPLESNPLESNPLPKFPKCSAQGQTKLWANLSSGSKRGVCMRC